MASRRPPAPKRLHRRGRMLLVAGALGVNAACGGEGLVSTGDAGTPRVDGGSGAPDAGPTDAGLIFGIIVHHDAG